MPDETLETPQPQPKADRPLDETLESKPTNWPKMVLTAVLGLALLAGAAYAGYWYGTESAKVKSQISKPQPETEKPTPVPLRERGAVSVEQPPTDWKTYTDSNCSFKYPDTWVLNFSSFNDEIGMHVAELAPGHLTPNEDISCEEYFDRIVNGGPEIRAPETNVGFPGGFPGATLLEVIGQEKMEVGEMELNLLVAAFMLPDYRDDEAGAGVWFWHMYCIKKDNRLFRMNFYERTFSTHIQDREIHHQILSTFKFLD